MMVLAPHPWREEHEPMITQHVVSYGGDITLTRLPAGRAEGYVWLPFVAAGAGIDITLEPKDMWHIHDHVRLTWLDGTAGDVVGSGGGGGDKLHHFLIEVLDAGYDRLIISYVEGDEVIGHEVIELPSRV
jgi:hypothetical protein